ncbi:Replication factor A protein 1, partial [Spiromyces aspiralis]
MQSQQQRQQAAPGGGAYPPTGASFGSRFGNQDGGFAAQRQAGAAAGAASQPNVYPIKGLNPYQSKWTIRARVSEKSGIKTWRNARGEGTLFSVNLIDESGEIRGTAFRDQVDRLYPQFEVGKVYLISKGAIKMAKSQFSNVQNEYEIAFDYSTDVVPCQDTEAVPTARYSFISLDKLGQLEKNTIVDVLVVAQDVRELTSIVSRTTNNEIQKRDVQVVDESMYQVRLTLWGDDARSFEAYDRPVVAFKGVKVGDFGGRTLSLPG